MSRGTNAFAQISIGQIYLMGFTVDVPVGTFDRDVCALGMKYLKAVAVAEQNCEGDDAVISS